MNYQHRRRNQAGGNWFVGKFLKDAPPTLEQLKKDLGKGKTDSVDHMIYYSKNVRGSDGYWRAKKAELYTWINYHVDMGHGTPTLFVTLSCAEYFWPDLKRLLEERIYAAESRVVDLDKNDSERNRAVNDYSIVVQEFFQVRCRDYLDTVCKDLFKIKHYWCRFEFPKSRGQIHAHLLAITETALTRME